MDDKQQHDQNFNARLDKALQKYAHEKEPETDTIPKGSIGRAFMLGIEFFSAIAIAALLGVAFDHGFNTKPWGLIVFFFLGIAAAFLNIYRFVHNMGYDIGYDSDNNKPVPPAKENKDQT